MVSFIFRRLLLLIPVLFGVSLLIFFVSHVVPADPARLVAGPHAGPAQVAAVRHAYGLDQPLWRQYLTYIGNTLHGDLGTSLRTQRPVRQDIADYLPATIELACAALVLSIVVGIPLGVVAATSRARWIDTVIRLFSIMGISIPVFWLGLVAQLVLYDWLGWFPSGGRLDTGLQPPHHITGLYTVDSLLNGNLPLFVNSCWHLILPAVVLSLGSLAVIARMMRSSMLEVLHREYIRTSRAKGVGERGVIWHHAVRNALLPTITVAGLQAGYLLSGAILVETVFSWYGIGLYSVQAVLASDYNAIMSVTLLIGAIFILVNLLVDVLYAFADPRIRYS